MREIKFRAWDKDDKSMSKPFSLEMGDQIAWRDVEIMQYTGLKDKNGVEVYEGDIVASEEWPDEQPLKSVYVIAYKDDEARYQLKEYFANDIHDDYLSGEWSSNSTLDEVELHVIGNIHENKELLK